MASLFNTRISDTYSGLIKTIDNAALTSSLKELTDGSGLASGVFMNTAGDFKVTAILEFGSLKDTGENITISKFVDAADGVLNNDNDTSIPTTAAIIDYVQGHVTLQDLDFEGDSGNGSVDLDSQLLDIAGTANQITTLASNQTLTISFDSSGVVLPDGSTATTQSQGDNSTKVATTAYVDILDAASDLDFSGDSGTGDVNLNTQTFAVTGTTNQIVTAASGQGLSLSLPATVHRNLQGDVTGDVTGDLTGNVTATSVLADGVTATTQASSDDSTKVATTAYVKSLNNASDLDFTTDSGSGAVILNSQTFSVVGTTNEIETSGSGQQIQIGLPSSINVNVTGNTTGTHTGAVVGNVTGDVVGDLTGNADTATAWETARDLSITGQATGTISSVDGTNNVSGAVTLDNNSVTSKVLTGLTSPSASSVLATDTIVEGFGKLQSQVNGLAGGLRFMDSWDADTNSPVLSSGGGEAANGTTTGVQANKLIDSSASFTTTVTVGDKVINQVDGQSALVTNIDSNTTLSLDADIMLSGEDYTIDNSPFITQGHYYVVSVGGTTTLNGISNWTVGDWVIAGANNQWTKLDHSQIDGTGTTGNLTKWSATQVIADSIVSESGSAITVDGSLSTNTNLSSTGDFAVNTNKFTVAAASGNTAFAGDLAINTNKFTVNSTTGNTLVAGTLDVTGKTTFGDDITISDGTPILDFEDTNNTDSNWRMEARGSFGGFFFQSFDNNFQTGSTVLFAKSSNGYIGLGGNTNPQAELDITGGLIAKDVFTTDSTGSTITVSRDAVPTSGNGLGQLEFSGEDIDTGNQYVTAQISASAEANWATSSRTTQLNFNTTTGGVLSRALTLKGNNDAQFEGNVGIGVDPSFPLHIKSSTNIVQFESTTNGLYNQYKSTDGIIGYVGSGSQTVSGGATTDFGIQSPLGSLIIATGGNTERMRIDSSGNSTFAGSVTIDSSTATLNLTGSNTGASLINFADAADGNVGRIYYDHTNNFMQFKTNDSEKLRIDSSGSMTLNGAQDALTINTTDADGPYAVWKNTTNATLGFVGNANSLASAGNTNFAVRATNDLIFASGGGTERMRIDSNGVVTITRSLTPAASLSDITQLKIENTDTSFGGSAAGIQLDAGNGDTTGFILSRADGNDNTFEGVIIGTATDNPIIFSTNTGTTSITSNERMRIDNAGAVIIGNGVAAIDTATRLQVSGSSSGITSVWSNADDIVFENNNNFGITLATPNTGAATIAFADPEAVNEGFIQYVHGDDYMRFATNQLERMRVDSSGVVQIKNDLPRLQLYNTDTGLVLDQVIGTLDFYKSDPSGSGVGVSSSIQVKSASSIGAASYMAFHTDGGSGLQNLERMVIDSSGSILYQTGGGKGYEFGASGSSASAANMFCPSGFTLAFGTNNTERMRITSAGIIEAVADISSYTNTQTVFAGYGDTDSGQYGIALNTAGNGLAGSIASNLKYSDGTITQLNTGRSSGEIKFTNATTASQTATISFGGYYKGTTSFVERMRITSIGNVAIGTSTNYHQFEPEADMDFNFVMNAGQVNASPNYTIKSSTSGGAITSRLQLIGSTGNMTITGSLTQNGSISDISLKENIKPVENGLDKIDKLNAVTFDWKKSDSILQLKEDYGFIAQEVEKVIPEIVRTNDDDKKAINYNGITSVLVKAIQELKAEVDKLKQECKCKN